MIGPPVCMSCMVMGHAIETVPGHFWKCLSCGDLALKGSLFAFTPDLQLIIRRRTNLFTEDCPKTNVMKTQYICQRKFMNGTGSLAQEPNEYFRHWLETHIGAQGQDWSWDISRNNLDMIEIHFADKEHATLFELAWPQ